MVGDARLHAAYAACAAAARAHAENFPVASMLVPRGMRRHVTAVYAFARAADDFADEGQRSREERQRLLSGWHRRLRESVDTPLPGPPPAAGEPASAVDIFLALGATIREKALPLALFEDLLSAFAQDVVVTRYDSWEDLLDYCRRSANPVGRLVLRIAGYSDERFDRWSDAICTALQLTNFWQDLAIDFARGRIYVPAADARRHGTNERQLAGPLLTPSWRAVLAEMAARTRALFAEGRPLCDHVRGRLRYELRATWLGGVRILERLERDDFDVFVRRPTLAATDLPWLAWRLATWSAARGHEEHEDGIRHKGRKDHKVKAICVFFVLFVANSSLWAAWLPSSPSWLGGVG
jgi:squalene synthase HpnC